MLLVIIVYVIDVMTYIVSAANDVVLLAEYI